MNPYRTASEPVRPPQQTEAERWRARMEEFARGHWQQEPPNRSGTWRRGAPDKVISDHRIYEFEGQLFFTGENGGFWSLASIQREGWLWWSVPVVGMLKPEAVK